MILYLDDWKNYPHAIVDNKTKNKTFIHLAQVYRAMGVKNHAFLLALHNPLLQGVDPHDPNLTEEQKFMIATEVKENPWYFFRECLRIKATGFVNGVQFQASRANIAFIWACFVHLTTMLIMPRQTGKSVVADCVNIYMLLAGGINLRIILLTKNHDLRTANIDRIKSIMDLLPRYLDLRTKKDANNMETITVNATNNMMITAVGQPTEAGALGVGRGFTSSILNSDETAFTAGIDMILQSAIPATAEARLSAQKAGAPYYNTYTTTPGYLHTKEGKYVKNNIYDACARWSETFFDLNEEELKNVITKASRSGRFWALLEYNHRQLGKTDEWLRQRILELPNATEDSIKAEYLNIWSTGTATSPIPKEYLNNIHNSLTEPRYIEISKDGYVTKWYIPEDEVKDDIGKRKIVMGLDTSEMVGRDGTCLVGIDAHNGEVIVTGTYNDTNTITLSNHLADMLIRFPNITLVPETKSTGVSIVDNIALILSTKGQDPFSRIYNIVVNDYLENEEYKEIVKSYKRPGFYTDYRKEFGYRTAGSGRAARDNLYGSTFQTTVKFLGSTIRDSDVINQLESLVTKNGRIDHPEGGHDDYVIAMLLPVWFLTNAKNLDIYGLNSSKVLNVIRIKKLDDSGGPVAQYQREKNERLKNELNVILDGLKRITDPYIRMQKIVLVRKIYNYLEDQGEILAVNMEDLLKQIKQEERILKYNSYKFRG